MVFINFPFNHKIQFLNYDSPLRSKQLKITIQDYLGTEDFSIYHNGRKLNNDTLVSQNDNIHVVFTLPGGKGGFGSMLRAIGAQIEKTTNREACRDLSGRRLRDINEELRLKKWLEKESERKAEKLQRKRQRIERLKSKPKHNFVDFDYEKEISELPERIDEALTEGMQKAVKRPLEDSKPQCSKKKNIWLHEDLSDSSCSDFETSDFNKSNSSKDDFISFDKGESSNSQEDSEMIHSCDTEISCNEELQVHNAENFSSNLCDEAKQEKTESVPKESNSEIDSVTTKLVLNKENNLNKPEVEGSCNADTDLKTEETVDLLTFKSSPDLESLGLERLKKELSRRGLKCGGSLKDRADRLWAVRALSPQEYPVNLRARK